jgi:hypothetical protein
VPCGVDFQSTLWHRMADSDVVILLDTPDFRTSHWTQRELSQANTTNFRFCTFFGRGFDESSAFSEFVRLSAADFQDIVGSVMQKVKDLGVDDNTSSSCAMPASSNGPAIIGSAQPLVFIRQVRDNVRARRIEPQEEWLAALLRLVRGCRSVCKARGLLCRYYPPGNWKPPTILSPPLVARPRLPSDLAATSTMYRDKHCVPLLRISSWCYRTSQSHRRSMHGLHDYRFADSVLDVMASTVTGRPGVP